MGMAVYNEAHVSMLTVTALDHLWGLYPDVCCPTCCGPCSVLQDLADSDDLETYVNGAAQGSCYWDEANAQVDRDWLARRWRKEESQCVCAVE